MALTIRAAADFSTRLYRDRGVISLLQKYAPSLSSFCRLSASIFNDRHHMLIPGDLEFLMQHHVHASATGSPRLNGAGEDGRTVAQRSHGGREIGWIYATGHRRRG
jgi:hypothetical protein